MLLLKYNKHYAKHIVPYIQSDLTLMNIYIYIWRPNTIITYINIELYPIPQFYSYYSNIY